MIKASALGYVWGMVGLGENGMAAAGEGGESGEG